MSRSPSIQFDLITSSISAFYLLCNKAVLPHDLSLIIKIANALVAFFQLGTERMGLPEGDAAGIRLIIIEVIFFVLSIGAVGLRIWSRRLKRRPLGLDDYSVVLGLVCVPFNRDQQPC